MPIMLVSKVRVVSTKAVASKAVVVAMIRVMGRPVVWPMPQMPMISESIWLIHLRGTNQVHPSGNYINSSKKA